MADSVRPSQASSVEERLAQPAPVLLDGATGTELERHGVACTLPLWSAQPLVDSPDLVLGIHRAYADAGAEILTANTFRTQRRTLAQAGLGERDDPMTTMAVALARSAAREANTRRRDAPRVFVAGSAAPLADCFRPDLVPPDAELAAEHGRHCELLAAAAVDLILVETMNCVREAVAAASAAFAQGLPVFVSFCCDARGHLLSGEELAHAIDAVCEVGTPLAVLVNCLPPSALPESLAVLRGCGLRFGLYPNLGAPLGSAGRGRVERSEALSPDAFAQLAADLIAQGASIVGGCCGTSPAHIAATAGRIR